MLATRVFTRNSAGELVEVPPAKKSKEPTGPKATQEPKRVRLFPLIGADGAMIAKRSQGALQRLIELNLATGERNKAGYLVRATMREVHGAAAVKSRPPVNQAEHQRERADSGRRTWRHKQKPGRNAHGETLDRRLYCLSVLDAVQDADDRAALEFRLRTEWQARGITGWKPKKSGD